MAGLYSILSVTGTQLALDGTEKPFPFYFYGAKDLYKDADWQTATGLKDVTETHNGLVVISTVGSLILHGILRSVEVELKDSDSGKVVATKKVRYAATKSKTIEEKQADGGLVGLSWKGAGKFNGKKVKQVIERRETIVD